MPDVHTTPAEVFVFGPFLLLPARRTLLRDGQQVPLGERAFELLLALVARPSKIVERAWLLSHVWPDLRVDDSVLRAHVASLRKALGDTGIGPTYIASVLSRGYCFVADVTRCAPPSEPAPLVRHPVLHGGIARLIGRDATLAAVDEALERQRLVTLTGPGGMGKTSVAAAVAARRSRHYEHGVHLIDLASVTDPRAVFEVAARSIGLRIAGEPEPQLLAARLAQRSAMLVLDNCEHVLEPAVQLVQALLKARGIHVLTTSRQPLGLPGEHVERLAPLSMPPAHAALPMAQAMLFPAIELFVDRATASFDEILLGDADSDAIADLCRQLDGVPYAIELVAAQIGFYGLAGLRTLLSDAGSLSALGRRTVQPRHRSLRHLLDWSYQLLAPRQQQLMCELSVFQGRFTLVDAVNVCGHRAGDVADALNDLVQRSLLNLDSRAGVPHYSMMKTTRAFAAERLAEDEGGAHLTVARRHANHCINLARRAALVATSQASDKRADDESAIEDVQAALAWAFDQGDAIVGANLVLQAAPLFTARRLQREHGLWLTRALERLDEGGRHERLRLQLLIEHGQNCLTRGERDQAMSAWRLGIELAQRLAEVPAQLDAMAGIFEAHAANADYAATLAVAQQYESLANSSDAATQRTAHRLLGTSLHLAGQHETAMTHAILAMAPSPQVLRGGTVDPSHLDHHSRAMTLQARLLWTRGLADQAMKAANDAVAASHEVGHAFAIVRALAWAACPIAIWRGDGTHARRHVQALGTLSQEHGIPAWRAWADWYCAAIIRLGMDDAEPHAPPAIPPVPALEKLLATFHPDFDHAAPWSSPAEVPPDWCSSERMRHVGDRLAASGEFDRAKAWLQAALDLAKAQQSLAWTLRASTSLARLLAPTNPLQARALMAQALVDCREGWDTSDVRDALALAHRLDDAASVRIATHSITETT